MMKRNGSFVRLWSIWLCFLLVNTANVSCTGGARDDESFDGVAFASRRDALAAPVFAPPKPVQANEGLAAIPGSVSVSPSGQSRWSSEVLVPPGRQGMAPQMSISYASDRGMGLLGLGFSVGGISSISRCWSKLATDGKLSGVLDAVEPGLPDKLCLDGERLIPQSTGVYRLDMHPGVRVETVGAGFVVRDGLGGIRTYGVSSDAVLAGPRIVETLAFSTTPVIPTTDMPAETLGTNRVLAWYLSKKSDKFGNYVQFKYLQHTEANTAFGMTNTHLEVVPDEILWTGNGALLPQRSLKFLYEKSVSDKRFGFSAGVATKKTLLLTRLQAFAPDGLASNPLPKRLVHEYLFDYLPNSVGTRPQDRLASIKLCFVAATGASACLAPTQFVWSGSNVPVVPTFTKVGGVNSGFDYPVGQPPTVPPPNTAPAAECWKTSRPVPDSVVGDFNGDGVDDVLFKAWVGTGNNTQYLEGDVAGRYSVLGRWYLRLGSPSGLGPRTLAGLDDTALHDGRFTPRAVDINRDGKTELIVYRASSANQTVTAGYDIYTFGSSSFSKVQGAFEPVSWPLSALNPRVSFWMTLADFDGDGVLDLVRDRADYESTNSPLLFRKGIAGWAGTGSPYAAATQLFPSGDGGNPTVPGDERSAVDVDGDGVTELLIAANDVLPPLPPGTPMGSNLPTEAKVQYTPSVVTGLASAGPVGFQRLPLPGTVAESSQRYASEILGRSQCPVVTSPAGPTPLSRWWLDINGDGIRDTISRAAFDDLPWGGGCNYGTGSTASNSGYVSALVSFGLGGTYKPMGPWQPQREAQLNPSMGTIANPAVPNVPFHYGVDNGLRILDADGDGRDDLLQVSRSTTNMGFASTGPWSQARGASGSTNSMVLVRSTGNGFVPQSLNVPLAPADVLSMAASSEPQASNPRCREDYGPRTTQLGDFNGDGLVDILQLDNPANPVAAGGVNFVVYQQDPRPPSLVTGIFGAHIPSVDIEYSLATVSSSSGIYTRTVPSVWPQAVLPGMGWVVSSVKRAVGQGRRIDKSYTYSNLRHDMKGRGTLGVDRRTETVKDESGVLYSTTVDTYDWTTTIPGLGASANGYMHPGVLGPATTETTVVLDSGHTLLSRSNFFHTVEASSVGGFRVSYDKELRYQFDNQINTSAVETTASYDSYGNNVFRGSRVWDGQASSIPSGGYNTEIATTMNPPDTTAWLVGLAQYEVTTNWKPGSSVGQVRRVDYTYSPSNPAILQTDVHSVPGAPAETQTSSGYSFTHVVTRDSYGNVSEERMSTPTVVSGVNDIRSLVYSYLPTNTEKLAPDVHTNGLGHAVTYWLAAGSGKALFVDDANGVRSRLQYDQVGRVSRLESGTNNNSDFTYASDSVSQLVYGNNITSCVQSNVTGRACKVVDPYGNTVQTTNEVLSGDMNSVVSFFDRFGRLTSRSRPSLRGASTPFDYFEYDKAGRPTKHTRPSGAGSVYVVKVSYSGSDTSILDELETVTHESRNFADQVIERKSVSKDGSQIILTKYEYGYWGLPVQIFHPSLGNAGFAESVATTRFEYDALGRKTRMEDPGPGTVDYYYNGFGEVKRVVDGNGAATTYARDGLGRTTLVQTLATANYPSVFGTQFAQRNVFVYDTAAYGVGKLAVATANASDLAGVSNAGEIETRYAYDSFGRTKSTTVTEKSLNTSYAVSYGYKADQDLLSSITYPSFSSGPALSLEYSYAGNGSVRTISTGGPGARILWNQVEANAAGQVTREQFGNTALTDTFYDEANNLHLQRTVLSGSGQLVQNLAYEWAAGGQLRKRHDLTTSLSEVFTSDFVGRLTGWDVTENCSTEQWRYVYDDRGNLTQKRYRPANGIDSVFQDLVYGSPGHADAVANVYYQGNRLDYFYDGAGNVTSGRGNTIQWTPFGLPASITAPGVTSTFAYDAFGARIRQQKTSNGVITKRITVGGLYELSISGTSWKEAFNVSAGGRVVAQVLRQSGASESTTFFHSDHLGNPDATTTQNGAIGALSGRAKYDPFGQRRFAWSAATPSTSRHPTSVGFTGHEPDDDFELTNMRGRIYDTVSSRFLSPDPVASGGSQGLNRYSYVFNAPMINTDPSGYVPVPQFVGGDPVLFAEKIDSEFLNRGEATQGTYVNGRGGSFTWTTVDDGKTSDEHSSSRTPARPQPVQISRQEQAYLAPKLQALADNAIADLAVNRFEEFVANDMSDVEQGIWFAMQHFHADRWGAGVTGSDQYGNKLSGWQRVGAIGDFAGTVAIEVGGALLVPGEEGVAAAAVEGVGEITSWENVVYRVIRPDENPAIGIFAKNPLATYSVQGHVINGSRQGFASQFISTTKDLAVAERYAAESGNRIVAIDLGKVVGSVHDVSKGGVGWGKSATNWARSSQEVLIEGHIPAEAILRVR